MVNYNLFRYYKMYTSVAINKLYILFMHFYVILYENVKLSYNFSLDMCFNIFVILILKMIS